MSESVSGYVAVRIKTQIFAALAECEAVTGKTIQQLLDEALEEYCEATVSSYVEEAALKAASA